MCLDHLTTAAQLFQCQCKCLIMRVMNGDTSRDKKVQIDQDRVSTLFQMLTLAELVG